MRCGARAVLAYVRKAHTQPRRDAMTTATIASLKPQERIMYQGQPHTVRSCEHRGHGQYELVLECSHLPEGVALERHHANKLVELAPEEPAYTIPDRETMGEKLAGHISRLADVAHAERADVAAAFVHQVTECQSWEAVEVGTVVLMLQGSTGDMQAWPVPQGLESVMARLRSEADFEPAQGFDDGYCAGIHYALELLELVPRPAAPAKASTLKPGTRVRITSAHHFDGAPCARATSTHDCPDGHNYNESYGTVREDDGGAHLGITLDEMVGLVWIERGRINPVGGTK